ncbi:hypothetical protein LCGC14_1783920 [marine sediment metagenome]|uniref:Uncharacterized protein n=1 Tax=marine sediment metagenome TaxID=412755 RepID=A0A0F9GUP1_9ZZZZ
MEYNYTREIVDGAYNIDNINRTDANRQIYLYDEIAAAFPGWVFSTNSVSVSLIISSQAAVPDQTQLDTIISDHKNNL